MAHFEYDAWGSLLPTSDLGPLADWSYLFVGSLAVRWDAATGLYSMRQRWYDPGLERFVSREPIGYPGGLNLYAYANADPVSAVDPVGDFATLGLIIGVAAAELVAAAAAAATHRPSDADIASALQSVRGRLSANDYRELAEILRYWQKEYPSVTTPPCEITAERTKRLLRGKFHFKDVTFGQDVRYHRRSLGLSSRQRIAQRFSSAMSYFPGIAQ